MFTDFLDATFIFERGRGCAIFSSTNFATATFSVLIFLVVPLAEIFFFFFFCDISPLA